MASRFDKRRKESAARRKSPGQIAAEAKTLKAAGLGRSDIYESLVWQQWARQKETQPDWLDRLSYANARDGGKLLELDAWHTCCAFGYWVPDLG